MKKIINGRKYDTETAKKLGHWENEYSISDFKHCEETLYKKRTGEFFLYGEAITPMTEKDAKRWTEKHLTADEYESIFGNVEE